MLESADHLIEKHRAGPIIRYPDYRTPRLPEGWILYSAHFELDGAQKGWHVELMDTTKPFENSSIVDGWHNQSLDTALLEANSRVLSAASPGRG